MASASGTITAAPQVTAVFTPADRCTSLYYNSINIISLGQREAASVSACFPSGWASATTNYLSGSLCPSGYAFAASSNLGVLTTGLCCPSSYSTVSGTLALSPFFTGMLCTSEYYANATIRVTTTNSLGSYVPEALTVTHGDGINAYGVSLRWTSATTTSSSSSTTTSTTTSSATASTTSSAAASISSAAAVSNDTDSGLSTGAKAGIGAGVAVGVLALIAVLAFVFMRKRRQSTAGTAAAAPATQYQDQYSPNPNVSELGSPMQEQKFPGAGSAAGPPAAQPYQEYYGGGGNGGYQPVQQNNGYGPSSVMHEMPGDSSVHR